jgi:hypothetical protein
MRRLLAITLFGLILLLPNRAASAVGNLDSIRTSGQFDETAIAMVLPTTGDPSADLAALMALASTLLTLANAVQARQTQHEAEAGDPNSPEWAARSFLDALKTQDRDRAITFFSPSGLELAGHDLESARFMLLEKGFGSAEILGYRILENREIDSQTLVFHVVIETQQVGQEPRTLDRHLTLRREEGAWRVAPGEVFGDLSPNRLPRLVRRADEVSV